MPKPLTQACLKEVLSYDPLTGVFIWLPRTVPEKGSVHWHKRRAVSNWNSRYAGKRAGSVHPARRHGSTTDYWRVRLEGSDYAAHRLVILYMDGSFPPKGMEVDHKDNDGLNNRYDNLRVVTSSQNKMNVSVRGSNSSGVTGVHWRKDTFNWAVQIMVRGKKIHIGHYKNKEDAIKVRKAAELKYFGEYRYKGKS